MNYPLCFEQAHVTNIRRRMIVEILGGDLPISPWVHESAEEMLGGPTGVENGANGAVEQEASGGGNKRRKVVGARKPQKER